MDHRRLHCEILHRKPKKRFLTTQQKAWRRKAELLLAQTRWLIPNIQKFRWSCIQLPKCYSCSSSCFCKQPRPTCPWRLCWTCVSERRSVLFCFIDLLFNGSRLVSLPSICTFFLSFFLVCRLNCEMCEIMFSLEDHYLFLVLISKEDVN